MLQSYYDASGTQADQRGALTIAGVAASPQAWDEFVPRWEEVLSRFGAAYSHMKEFAHSTGEFEEWKGDHARRRSFMSALIDILEDTIECNFVVMVDMRFYHKLQEMYAINEEYLSDHPNAGAYGIGMMALRDLVPEWGGEQYPGWKAEHYVAHGDAGQGALVTALARQGKGLVRLYWQDPKTGEYRRELEAADMVAYEFGQIATSAFTTLRMKPRKSASRIINNIPRKEAVLDGLRLRQAIEALSIPKHEDV